MKVQANGIAIEVEDTGETDRPVVLLVMGLGLQLISWPPPFLRALNDAGFRVVRFDNRDVGLSQHFDDKGLPNLMWEGFKQRVGLPVKAPYTLDDMASDTLGVLDALGIARAHIVGVSMGGMIAQRVAIRAPERVTSLSSIMSSSGARFLPGPKPQVLQALFSRPAGTGEAGIVDHFVKVFRIIGSPGFPTDEASLREGIRAGVRRSYHPAGTMRQMAAVAADTRRARELARVKSPTLVIHGRDDPLVPLACGHDTARRIRGARMMAVHGMGHDLPPGVCKHLVAALVPHLRQAEGP
ncbi:alpha/beta fold hydrolase [Ramlibacter sp.]|uniref:alpha/beta fold hydrolase n=1 Tax=Ramlibacter sp. TaxID=1917967 RepID=UPI003D103D29